MTSDDPAPRPPRTAPPPHAAGTDQDFAEAFEHAFQLVYLRFHRRDGKRSGMTAASRSVLTHLGHAGPLTVGEMAQHLDRAQSVVSDIVSGLETKGLLAREPDPADRRRTLVWLTPAGFAALDADRRVLSLELLRRAGAHLAPHDRAALLGALHALLDARGEERSHEPEPAETDEPIDDHPPTHENGARP